MRRQPTGGAYDPLSIPARRGDLWEEATLPRTQGPHYSLRRPFLRKFDEAVRKVEAMRRASLGQVRGLPRVTWCAPDPSWKPALQA